MIVLYMGGLGFHRVEHSNFFVKTKKNLINVWPITLCEKSHVFCLAFSLHFNCSGNIKFLLFGTVEPTHEESRSLRLMTISRTTDVKQHIGVLPKELLHDTNQSLSHLLVAGRRLAINISQIEPVCCEIGVSVIVKVDSISKTMFSSEHKEFIVILYIVWRMFVDSVSEKSIHDLNPLQVIIARLSCCLLAAQTFCKFRINFLFPRFFALSSSIQPRKDFFLGPYGTIQCLCFHNLFYFNDSGCKIKNYFRIKQEK